MYIYHYHPTTYEYMPVFDKDGNPDKADESPLEPGVYLIPAYATAIAPPAIPAGQQARFTDGAWALETVPEPPTTPSPTPPALEDLKRQKHDELRLAFDVALDGGFTASDGITYDCNRQALNDWDMLDRRIDRQGLTMLQIRDHFNQDRTMTVEQFRQALLEIGNHFDTLFIKKNQLQNQAAAATTAAELELIRW